MRAEERRVEEPRKRKLGLLSLHNAKRKTPETGISGVITYPTV
jgi:hypothetical protein